MGRGRHNHRTLDYAEKCGRNKHSPSEELNLLPSRVNTLKDSCPILLYLLHALIYYSFKIDDTARDEESEGSIAPVTRVSRGPPQAKLKYESVY
jgi:hypothetical protein